VKFLALIYGDENAWEGLSEREREAVLAKYRAFSESGNGKIVGGAEAAPTRSATTVRVRDGQTQVTDGPAEDLAEPLGGFFLFECETIDEAVQLAARIPGAETGSVEVWPAYVEGEES
jgi:hypothetical protein